MKWEEPPENSGRWGKAWAAEAAELRAHPKRWALLTEKITPDQARIFASQIRRGELVVFRSAGDWEARSIGIKVYARFVGEPDAES